MVLGLKNIKSHTHPASKNQEEMSKILTALKFFKEHNNNLKPTSSQHKRGEKNKENVAEKGRDSAQSNKNDESRPRTSRDKRASKRRKSGSNNNSAMGFYAKMPHSHLAHMGEDNKNIHNRSVNIPNDSPWSKSKRKLKNRISPNVFAQNNQKNVSLEAEKIAMLNKSRPKSAKSKVKKGPKTVIDRSKKMTHHRHNNSMHAKPDFYPSGVQNGVGDGAIVFDDASFDKDEKLSKRLIKRLNQKPGRVRASMDTSLNNKPKHKNLHVQYEHMNYLEDFHKMHSNIEGMMKQKHNLKMDSKKRAVAGTKKRRKNKRSATPALAMAQGYGPN